MGFDLPLSSLSLSLSLFLARAVPVSQRANRPPNRRGIDRRSGCKIRNSAGNSSRNEAKRRQDSGAKRIQSLRAIRGRRAIIDSDLERNAPARLDVVAELLRLSAIALVVSAGDGRELITRDDARPLSPLRAYRFAVTSSTAATSVLLIVARLSADLPFLQHAPIILSTDDVHHILLISKVARQIPIGTIRSEMYF
jgi:hypothetical protein